jgi:hypothetical protein
VEREDLAKTILEILARYATSNFHFLFIGDESWLLSACHVRTMWTICQKNVDEVQPPSQPAQEAMVTVLFHGGDHCTIIAFGLLSRWEEMPRTKMHCAF